MSDMPNIGGDDVARKVGAEKLAAMLEDIETAPAEQIEKVAQAITHAAREIRDRNEIVATVLSALRDAPAILAALA